MLSRFVGRNRPLCAQFTTAAAARMKVANRKPMDYENIGFEYLQTRAHVEYTWSNGSWDAGKIVDEPMVSIHAMSPALHYGQTLFEGMKAFECKDGHVRYFHPMEANHKRMALGCARLAMPHIPADMFSDAVGTAVRENIDYVPPFGAGAMYIRPFVFGSGAKLGLGPAPEYKFIVLVAPVGDYYKGQAMSGVDALVMDDFDRAAPLGTGNVKVGGNYASDLIPSRTAAETPNPAGGGYPVCLYLDAKTRTYVEEFSTSNFVAISEDGKQFITPKSATILGSVTNMVLQEVAADAGLEVVRRPVLFDEVASFREVGAAGTAVVLTPIGSITKGGVRTDFEGCEELLNLRQAIVDVQTGVTEDTKGWLVDL